MRSYLPFQEISFRPNPALVKFVRSGMKRSKTFSDSTLYLSFVRVTGGTQQGTGWDLTSRHLGVFDKV